ncbi:MAG: hypothetical protein V1818_03815 [Candidatus Aenigmatarchaeota archaeon]
MKGISLPINVLVIVIVAVIVLLGVMALFMGTWSPFGTSMSAEAAKSAGCRKVINNCYKSEEDLDTYTKTILIFNGQDGLPNFDVDGIDYVGTGVNGDNMYNLCVKFYGAKCRDLCGCQ